MPRDRQSLGRAGNVAEAVDDQGYDCRLTHIPALRNRAAGRVEAQLAAIDRFMDFSF